MYINDQKVLIFSDISVAQSTYGCEIQPVLKAGIHVYTAVAVLYTLTSTNVLR